MLIERGNVFEVKPGFYTVSIKPIVGLNWQEGRYVVSVVVERTTVQGGLTAPSVRRRTITYRGQTIVGFAVIEA